MRAITGIGVGQANTHVRNYLWKGRFLRCRNYFVGLNGNYFVGHDWNYFVGHD